MSKMTFWFHPRQRCGSGWAPATTGKQQSQPHRPIRAASRNTLHVVRSPHRTAPHLSLILAVHFNPTKSPPNLSFQSPWPALRVTAARPTNYGPLPARAPRAASRQHHTQSLAARLRRSLLIRRRHACATFAPPRRHRRRYRLAHSGLAGPRRPRQTRCAVAFVNPPTHMEESGVNPAATRQ